VEQCVAARVTLLNGDRATLQRRGYSIGIPAEGALEDGGRSATRLRERQRSRARESIA
jgi:hypothetical protein